MADKAQQYVIEDYGSALVGKQTIDMYMPNMRMVRQWGVKHVEIEILEWGSKQMSLKLLEGRQRRDHVRQMVAALKKQGVRPLAANSSPGARSGELGLFEKLTAPAASFTFNVQRPTSNFQRTNIERSTLNLER
jgi:hypothetical protein